VARGCYGSGRRRGRRHRSCGGRTSRAGGWKVVDGMMVEVQVTYNADFRKESTRSHDGFGL
jgi:hypothetical protein